jgi:hypothetical protein
MEGDVHVGLSRIMVPNQTLWITTIILGALFSLGVCRDWLNVSSGCSLDR